MTRGRGERAQRSAPYRWAVRCKTFSYHQHDCATRPPPPNHSGYQEIICIVDIIYKISGSWCGDWERSTRRYANTGQQGQAGAESLPTIQEHISEAPTAASFERQQQAGLQPEQSEHSQFSKSGRGKKTNPGVNCKPRSSSGQGGDNTTATAGHVLSVSSLLWPTLSGSFAKKME